MLSESKSSHLAFVLSGIGLKEELIHCNASLVTIISRIRHFVYINQGSAKLDRGFLVEIFSSLFSYNSWRWTSYEDGEMRDQRYLPLAESCHMIADLKLAHDGEVDGAAMKSLLTL
jgi:hypothetical protein